MIVHTCRIDGCKKKTAYKTVCSKHWYQISKFGKPVETHFDKRPAVLERGYAKLPLGMGASQGYTLVDLKYSSLDEHKWRLSDQGYVVTTVKGRVVKLHRLIMNAQKGQVVDHISMDKTDNRMSNLRFATHSENHFNRLKQSTNTSGYKGVYWSKQKLRWAAKINKARKQYHLGFFENKEDAATAYNRAALSMAGSFARINKV